ncbi:DsbA family protein [Gordonia sp. zg691]|uniref:DsbA family protein n=1 Tax=Gordonia jinghuaiqii TaxID=2758710 RepID=A0A7D7RNH2_9ACTN|nr:thioredoxin domain-containing protein [Gordonia jinghuaiqii]MBD0859633.1 DsbA family protein [Gordonia jinghuaiqii]MCR5976860.1 thioredoxin domain-containing protein [Gordonia jinghuaiqii]QMT00513.1 DsbA family protein [Gordonia jinghuaiqii]
MSKQRKPGASVPRTTKSKYQPSAPSNTMTYVLGGIAVLVIAGLVIGGIWWSGRDKGEAADQSALASSSTMIVGPENAPLIDIFEDPLCPVCKLFEQQSGPAITKAVTEGQLRVRYHTLNFLNSKSASGDYSSRAAGALKCVAEEQNADLFLRFHSALYTSQPAEDGTGNITSPELARMATAQGATPATAQCITDNAKVAQAEENAKKSTDELSKATGGQVGTPSVLHDGKTVEGVLDGTGWLEDILGGNKS